MKSCLYLLILGITQLQYVVSIYINNINYESYPPYNFTYMRGKRAKSDYTRWRADLENTPEEFIVKVLDEDLPTSSKPIFAINLLIATKKHEKIIVGGAIVPTVTPKAHEKDLPKEYTRFVPPTTGVVPEINDLFLAPTPRIKISTNIPEPRALRTQSRVPYGFGPIAQRDDSPPASPQFIPRTSMLLTRQFAPVTPVTFTKFTLLTHLSTEISNSTKTTMMPMRTSPRDLIFLPTRTKSEIEDKKNESLYEEEAYTPMHDMLTMSTFLPQPILLRSSVLAHADEFDGLSESNKKTDTDYSKKVNVNKDFEPSYNSMFYSEEDNETGGHKPESIPRDLYDNKNKNSDKYISDARSTLLETAPHFRAIQLTSTTSLDHSYLDEYDLQNKTTIIAASKVYKLEPNATKLPKEKLKDRRHTICNLLKLRPLNFNSPRTLSEIVIQLKQWAEDSPVAKWLDITGGNYTTMENPIYLVIVDDPSSGQIVSAKQTVMIIAGIQGRDHHAVSAAMYVLYQLIERSEAHVDLLTKYRFWIIPVFNPDGYDYSITFPFRRGWTKNLRQLWDICKGRESCYACENYGLRCTIQSCYGVNLDRNFEYQWIPADELRSEHPCGDLYAGSRQLIEAETRALSHFLHEQRTSVHSFIAFKEGDILGVMYPYSHTRKKRAFDHVYRQRASRAASAAYSISGRPYVAGQTSEFLPLYAGGIEDWMDGHLGIDNTYTIMMFRNTDTYNTKLITERVVHEAYAAMDTLLLQSSETLGLGPVMMSKTRSAATLYLNKYSYSFTILPATTLAFYLYRF